MTNDLYYFAYGSNLHPVRLGERIPSSSFLGVTRVGGYCLKFHKRGGDRSGKCNALYTGKQTHYLLGAVYRMDAAHKPILDTIEGEGYTVEQMTLELGGKTCPAFAYIAESHHIDERLKPFHWYKELVSIGAGYHGFPSAYIEVIKNIESVADNDNQRHSANELLLSRMR